MVSSLAISPAATSARFLSSDLLGVSMRGTAVLSACHTRTQSSRICHVRMSSINANRPSGAWIKFKEQKLHRWKRRQRATRPKHKLSATRLVKPERVELETQTECVDTLLAAWSAFCKRGKYCNKW